MHLSPRPSHPHQRWQSSRTPRPLFLLNPMTHETPGDPHPEARFLAFLARPPNLRSGRAAVGQRAGSPTGDRRGLGDVDAVGARRRRWVSRTAGCPGWTGAGSVECFDSGWVDRGGDRRSCSGVVACGPRDGGGCALARPGANRSTNPKLNITADTTNQTLKSKGKTEAEFPTRGKRQRP